MTLEADQIADIEPQHAGDISSRRRLRVRHSYPFSMIGLVQELLKHVSARAISNALDIPLSSIYRWREEKHSSADCRSNHSRNPNPLADLFTACRRDGFPIPQSFIETLLHDFESGGSDRVTVCSQPEKTSAAVLPPRGVEMKTETDRLGMNNAKSRMDKILRVIHTEYFRDLDSRHLARVAGMSRHHFIHTFTAVHGISPHQYLLRVRVEAAKNLLVHSPQTIDVVAAATGFRSGACLNRAFTRIEGHCISNACRVVKTTETPAWQ